MVTHGYDGYLVDGQHRPEDLLEDLERFGTAAFKPRVRKKALDEPFVDEPGTLAVLATLSAICVKSQPTVEHTPPRQIQPLYDIREFYVNNLASRLRKYGDPSLYQEIAEVLYAKESGEEGHTPVVSVQESPRNQSSETACISRSRWRPLLARVSSEKSRRIGKRTTLERS